MSRPANNPLRVGIVGCGRAARNLHLPALRSLSEVAVTALSDMDPGQLNSAADATGVERRYVNYQDLANDPLVDIVAVCTPTRLHTDVALAAWEAGKHVLVEKPLALTLEDADQMVEEAEKAASVSVVGFNLRCHRLVLKAREIVRSGALGPIEMARTVWTASLGVAADTPAWQKNRLDGGGALFEIATHHADLCQFLLGAGIEVIHADSRSLLFDDQSVVLTARMSNGALVSGTFCRCTTNSHEIEIFGQNAALRFSCYRADSLEVHPISESRHSLAARLKHLARKSQAIPVVVAAALHGGDFIQSYRSEWRRFIGSIRRGEPPPSTIRDGREALRIILAAARSIERGEPAGVSIR